MGVYGRKNYVSLPKRLEAVSIDFDFYKIQYYLSWSRLNAILFVSEHFSWEEENERQISLALYIRLEYSFNILSKGVGPWTSG